MLDKIGHNGPPLYPDRAAATEAAFLAITGLAATMGFDLHPARTVCIRGLKGAWIMDGEQGPHGYIVFRVEGDCCRDSNGWELGEPQFETPTFYRH
jgi:hypothetical protein